jgi:hypothetical protein
MKYNNNKNSKKENRYYCSEHNAASRCIIEWNKAVLKIHTVEFYLYLLKWVKKLSTLLILYIVFNKGQKRYL